MPKSLTSVPSYSCLIINCATFIDLSCLGNVADECWDKIIKEASLMKNQWKLTMQQ